MRAICSIIIFISLSSCNSVDPQTKKEIRNTLKSVTNDFISGNREELQEYCTSNGLASLSKHFDLNSETDLKELGIFLRDQKISSFEKIDDNRNVKIYIGDYSAVTGRSAIVFIRVDGAWKIEKYLAGK